MTYCQKCGRLTEEWDTGYYARDLMCITCYKTYTESFRKVRCTFCAVPVPPENIKYITGQAACKNCYDDQKRRIENSSCRSCKKHINAWEKRHPLPRGGFVCDDCYKSNAAKMAARECARCFSPLGADRKILSHEIICGSCYSKKTAVPSLKNKFSSILNALLSNQVLPPGSESD